MDISSADDEDVATTSGSSVTSPTTGGPSTTTTPGPTSTTAPATSTTSTTSDDSTTEATSTGEDGATFLIGPDGGGCGVGSQCDLWAQDCPDGEKCTPSNMCGPPDTWSATSCVPVVADPAVPGDPCTIMDHPYSGHDDCDLGSMCFNADPETLTGVCIPLCTDSDASPVCDDRGSACLVANQGALPICVPTCNPLEPTCDEGQGCYVGTLVAQFVCLPEGVPVGIDGETPAACPAGSTDVDSALLATCTDDDEACCAAFCDTFDPVCSDGLTCVAIDEDALVLNQVGVCVDAA